MTAPDAVQLPAKGKTAASPGGFFLADGIAREFVRAEEFVKRGCGVRGYGGPIVTWGRGTWGLTEKSSKIG